MILVGPAGSGKTHLAHIWADLTGAAVFDAADIARANLAALPPVSAIAIENAERLGGNSAGQEALFHLHNLVLPAGRLLMTAASPPRDWGLTLPDLTSRMQAAMLTRLDPPDDALLSAVLIKLFADRQIAVPPTLIPYLLHRMNRSIASARDLVARLDAHALALGRPISRALAAELLDIS